MTQPVRVLRYRPELDGIRAIAVLLVIVFHIVQPRRFSGFVGVDVFFVLSGYLITTILLGEIERLDRLRLGRFYLRRLLRLYPALLVTVALSFIFYRQLSGTLLVHMKRAVVALTYTSNLYMTYRHRFIGGLAHTWSLALEEQYYLVWPVVLLLFLRCNGRRRTLATLLGLAAVAAAAFSIADYKYGASSYPIQSTSSGLLAGSALGVLLRSSWAVPARRILTRSTAQWTGIALFVGELILFSVWHGLNAGAYSPIAVVATVLVLGHLTVRTDGPVTRWLSVRPLVEVGRISYGMYLYHYPLLLVIRYYWSPSSAGLVALAVLEIVGTTLIAAASFRWVETPFLRLKDRFEPPGRPGARRYAGPAADGGAPKPVRPVRCEG